MHPTPTHSSPGARTQVSPTIEKAFLGRASPEKAFLGEWLWRMVDRILNLVFGPHPGDGSEGQE